jgi:hypothetical protein
MTITAACRKRLFCEHHELILAQNAATGLFIAVTGTRRTLRWSGQPANAPIRPPITAKMSFVVPSAGELYVAMDLDRHENAKCNHHRDHRRPTV